MALRSRAARFLLVLAALGLAGGAAAGVAVYLAFLRDLPDLRDLRDYRPVLASRVLDREGRLVGEFFDERRFLVPLEEVPRHVVLAFVAAEDDSFFEHQGLDYRAILRAAWVNFQAGGEIRQGGSTITQQVAKSLLLTPERRYTRKIKDMLLARRIEQHFSKEEILYLYLNQIYFGHGAYGIGEAARSYFGTTPGELTLSQAALLAGLPKAPSAYSPHNDPAAAEERRQYVLHRMYEEGYVSEAAYEEALATPPALTGPPEAEAMRASAWFVEEVRRALVEAVGGERLRRDGLRIETTLDLDDQRLAEAALRRGLEALDRRQGWRGPLRRVEPSALDAALADLARENALESAGAPAAPPVGKPLLGLVVRVDERGERAEVAFGQVLRGEVYAEDLAWARRPGGAPSGAASAIARVLRVGDVAAFVRPAAQEQGAAGADGPAEVASDGEPPRVLLHQTPLVEGALLSLDVATGDVLALVGGYDFARSEFDRVTQARRQPGSAFKPLIYAAALGHGWTPASIVVDRPLVYTDPYTGLTWRPGNYKNEFYGRVTLREALARSINNATIHLLDEVGVRATIDFARALGIESRLEPNLSLALGSSGVSLLELVRAYAVFPAEGRRVSPRFVARVLDREGRVVLENLVLGVAPDAAPAAPPETPEGTAAAPAELPDDAASADAPAPPPAAPGAEDPLGPVPPDHAISPVHAFLVTDLLRGVIEDPHGTGRNARSLGRPLAGKTGTTNEQADAWFVGFSPDVVAGVWVGFDEKRVLGRGETGGRAALPIWTDYMQAALAERPRRDFPVPDRVVFARIDRATGLLAGPSSHDTVIQAFAVGTDPSETSDHARTASESDRLLRLDAF